MADARRAVPSLSFNGKSVNTTLKDYIKSVSFTDVASGESDSISLVLQNIEMEWLGKWYPKKGDRIKGGVTLKNWNREGENKRISYGTYILDEIRYSGGPLTATFGGLAIPANDSFKTRNRTKTWKKVTLHGIASEIASRYGLGLSYEAGNYSINALEQSEENDSSFLYNTVKKYGLKMKVYNSRIVIFDPAKMEARRTAATLKRESFVGDSWDYQDSLEGTYTGARMSYKSEKKSDRELSVYVGIKGENAKGSRILRINSQADSIADAQVQARAQVNLANESMTTLNGQIWPDIRIVSGVTVRVTDMGKADGKYFVDKVTLEVSDSGTKQRIEMHKCQKRI